MSRVSIRVNFLTDVVNDELFKKSNLPINKSKDSLSPYITIAEYEVVPVELHKYILMYTVKETYYLKQPRISGLYKLGVATAQVSCSFDSNSKYYWLTVDIYGKCQKDILDLYYKIRAGEILPNQSWEDSQITRLQSLKEVIVIYHPTFFQKIKKIFGKNNIMIFKK